MTLFAERLDVLRKSMKENKLNAYIIPSSDPHLSEYIPDHWRIISWLTGFTGSAATVVVTDSFAGLWTDSRYFVQAEEQLKNSGFELMKPDVSENRNINSWLAENLDPGSIIGLDGLIFSIGRLRSLNKALAGKEISVNSESDLISDLWADRPVLPGSLAFDHSIIYSGKERAVKIAEVRTEMEKINIDYQFLTSPEDIMWLLNIRGNDIKFSPLLLSFAIVGKEQILLFASENSIPLRMATEFDKLGIVLLPYEETQGMLSALEPGSSLLLTPSTTSVSMYEAIPEGVKIHEDISIPTRLKAVKNSVEIENIGRAMTKDGVALSKFFYWVESNIGHEELTEMSLADKLETFRSEEENFLGASFSSIVAYNEHGALPHYSATPETDAKVGEGILLVDSGGQYLDGTTDITRTIAIGRPTLQQRNDFTRVLKGTINLAQAKFPAGTKGYQLDILARKALWESGLNFGHGSGHGVGFCLNVHEGPQNISPVTGSDSKISIMPGMLISDEPAIYREGEYGIRIENLILCYEDEETEFGKFLKFDTVSLCYIDKKLIDKTLLEPHELKWLNNYHNEVYEKLYQYLTADEQLWLREKTSLI